MKLDELKKLCDEAHYVDLSGKPADWRPLKVSEIRKLIAVAEAAKQVANADIDWIGPEEVRVFDNLCDTLTNLERE